MLIKSNCLSRMTKPERKWLWNNSVLSRFIKNDYPYDPRCARKKFNTCPETEMIWSMLWNNMNLSLLIEFCINQEATLIACQSGCKILATTMACLTPSLLPIPYVLLNLSTARAWSPTLRGIDSVEKLDWLDPPLPYIGTYTVGIRMLWYNGKWAYEGNRPIS